MLNVMWRMALETGISLQRSPIGEPANGAYLPGAFERWVKGAVEVERLFVRGNWREVGDPGGYVKEGSGDGHVSPKESHRGTCKWGLFTRGF